MKFKLISKDEIFSLKGCLLGLIIAAIAIAVIGLPNKKPTTPITIEQDYPADELSIAQLKNISKETSALADNISSMADVLNNPTEYQYALKLHNIALLLSWQVVYAKDILVTEQLHGKDKQYNRAALQEIYYSLGGVEVSLDSSSRPQIISLIAMSPNQGLEKYAQQILFFINQFGTQLNLCREDLKNRLYPGIER